MTIEEYLKKEECFKFLKWIEIIQQEDKAVKLDSMYILEKDKVWCEAIFIDGNGNKRKIGGSGGTAEISVITFNVNDNMHLSMQLETNTNLNFTLDNNGHLILTN